ncbi:MULTISPECIES: hypothetical protein [Pseudomonas]|jgi:hypothetical protein|uniref:hypothetical protein n=1 Tax=Pseudomonas sp. BF-R-19 TaxID=2832397 RepID=UPI001CBF8CC4|nr:hypothetical protein [Pseudomonas sp. BF-R-19]
MNKYISGKVLFSKTPYRTHPSYTTKTSLYKHPSDNESTLINTHEENSLKHKWWEFEFVVERDPSENSVATYRIIAEVFLPDGTLLAKADELLSIDFEYGTRHHEDIYLKPVFIV